MENKNKKYTPLRYTFTGAILLLIVLPILITISLIDYFTTRADLMANYELLQSQTESNINNTIQLVDTGYKMLEKSLDNRLKEGFKPFIIEYEEANEDPDKMNLAGLKEELGEDIDLYIINRDGVIFHTTNENDLGLDFTQWPDFYNYLLMMMEGEGYYADRMTPAIKTGGLTKFAYHPTPDNKYLLELGLSSNAFEEFIKDLDPRKIADKLKSFNPSILNINLYDENYFLEGEKVEISDEQKKIIDELWEKPGEVKEVKEEGKILRYFYIDRYDEEYATNVSRVSEIIYSTEIIDEKLNNKTIQKLIISAGAIALSILITFLVSSFISKPIHQIVEDVDHISAGNLDHKTSVNANNELKILEQSINLMVNNMKQYIDKITDSEEKIKEYNEHLEDMVEQRTSELNKVNKELKQINRAMLEELKMAQRVQESIIPNVKNLPHIGRLNYGSDYTAMENIGGDLYDVIRVGRNSCGLLMADVSGHGVPAALITTMAKVSFNSNSRWGLTTGEICNSINDELYDFIGDLEYYLTAYYGIIDLETGIFNYTNCGHHPAILYRKRTGEFIKLDTDGFFIGAFSKVEYETGEVQLEEGDRILLFTDGIIEARNENKEFYEYERLMKYLNDNSHLPTDVFVDNLIADVNEFCGDEPADDDRAVLYVEFVSKVHKGKSSGIDKSLKIDAKIEKEDKTSSTKHTIEGESKYNNKEFKELYNNSLDYLRNNKYEQALNVLIHLKDIKSDDIGVLNNLSICYYKLGRLEEASDILKYAMEIDENNEKIKKNKRIIDRKLNND